MPKLPSPVDLEAIPLAGIAGQAAQAESTAAAAFLSSMEIVNQTGERWIQGATNAEKAELLRAWLRRSGGSRSLLQMLEGGSGERIMGLAANRIPKRMLEAAGSARSQAVFTRLHTMLRQISEKGASAKDLKWMFNRTLKEAANAGLAEDSIDALRRMGPERVYKSGAVSIARVYDTLTKEPLMRRFMRGVTKGDPRLTGKKFLGTDPTRNLASDVRAQLDELEGMTRAGVAEEVAGAKGVVGKTRAGARALAAGPAEAAAADVGIGKQLRQVGAKGLGRGARALRAAGGGAAMLAVPLVGYELYDSLVGKSKRARAMLDASRSGGTASVSKELMYDILDKRADLEARRAQLAQDPQLMQQIVTAIGGQQAKTLTKSEAGFGIDLGPQGMPPDQMNTMLDRLLGQMRGS